MFDWFWKFLYSISKVLMKACDWLMDCALTLVGIKPISVDGESTDFLTYLITSDKIKFAFACACVLAMVVLVIFSIFAILRNVAKEQVDVTPAKIGVKAAKCLLMFIFVPAVMLVLVFFLNKFMTAIFEATSEGGNSIGSFLFTTFAEDAGLSASEKASFLSGKLDFYSYSTVNSCIDLSDFNYIFSWIVSGVVMFNLAASMIIFVDRAISIVILFIAAPFSISTTVIDDGGRFKAWRDQVLTKFLTAYGVIIALNIYILITGLVVNDGVVFFQDGTLNYVAKILIVLGGAFTMKKSTTLIASLLSSGGAQEMNDPTFNAARMGTNALAGAIGHVAGATAKGIVKYSPIGMAARYGVGSVANAFGRWKANKLDQFGNSVLNKFGLDTGYDRARLTGNYGFGNNDASPSDSENNNSAQYNNNNADLLKNALEGGNENDNQSNENNNSLSKGNQMLSNALQGSGESKSKSEE